MPAFTQNLLLAPMVLSAVGCLHGQSLLMTASGYATQTNPISLASIEPADSRSVILPAGRALTPSFPLFDYQDAEIKFQLTTLMNLLRDRQHEGWVLSAYPDPKTGCPLIGAGFSLDVEASPHPQQDALNPNQFLEPSSAELWQAAGLDPEKLQRILERFHRQQATAHLTSHRHSRRKVKSPPDLTEDEATRLLRISAIQAVSNAKAYCRNFDQLTAAQQLGLSQLVFQMGVNLEQFVQFLGTLNADFASAQLSQLNQPAQTEERWEIERWSGVQSALIDSQWARLFSARASSVIAMFDPQYGKNPFVSQQRVASILRPAVMPVAVHHPTRPLKTVAYRKRPSKAALNAHHKRQRT